MTPRGEVTVWWPQERVGRLWLAIALGAGALLRLWELDRYGLHNDELSTWAKASGATPGDVWRSTLLDVHPPGHNLLAWAWMRVAGEGDAVLRAPGAVASVLAIYLLFVLGRRLFGAPVGLIAAGCFALSPTAIGMARHFRAYSAVHAVSVLAAVLVLLWLERVRGDRASLGAALGAATSLAALLWLHYLALMFAVFLGAWLLVGAWALGGRRRVQAAAVLTLAGVLYLPWFGPFLQDVQAGGLSWVQAPRPRDLLRIGRWSHQPWLPIALLGAALAMRLLPRRDEGLLPTRGAAAPTSSGWLRRLTSPLAFAAIWALAMPLVMWLRSQQHSVWTPKNMTLIAPGEALLLGGLVVTIAGRRRGAIVGAGLLIALLVTQCLHGVAERPFLRQEFREAAALVVAATADESDPAIVAFAGRRRYFNHYFEQLESPHRVMPSPADRAGWLAVMAEVLAEQGEVWLLAGHKLPEPADLTALREFAVEAERSDMRSASATRWRPRPPDDESPGGGEDPEPSE